MPITAGFSRWSHPLESLPKRGTMVEAQSPTLSSILHPDLSVSSFPLIVKLMQLIQSATVSSREPKVQPICDPTLFKMDDWTRLPI